MTDERGNTVDITALYAKLESHRGYMLRFAVAKLRDSADAEEVVQEAMVGALEGIAGFSGDSTLRTWLTSILKFKIVDFQRRAIRDRERFVSVNALDDSTDPEWFDRLFDKTGHWRASFAEWPSPDAALLQKQFFEVFESCLDKLPATARRVFIMREVMGASTEEICKDENITSSNCWVMLHRARITLRECLDRKWFQAQPNDPSRKPGVSTIYLQDGCETDDRED